MKRHVICSAALALAFAGVSAAQSPSTATGQSPSTSPTQSATGQPQAITVTGCLIGTGAPGTTGSASAAITPGGFMLMNAMNGSGAAATSGSTGATGSVSGTTGSSAGSAGAAGSTGATGTSGTTAGRSYLLMGGNQEELQRFANSRVEIVGTTPAAAGSATGSAGSATGSATGTASGTGSSASGTAGTAGTSGTARPGIAEAPQQVTITSIRQVAGSCGGGL